MNGYFIFDDIDTRDYGVIVLGGDTFGAPERDVEIVEVPGRNGTLTLDNGRYYNQKVKYKCVMQGNFSSSFGAFKAAILANVGYKKLEDSWHTDGFRMARIISGFQPDQGVNNQSGAFTIEFDCYPQFFLNSGQEYTYYDSESTITNPTLFVSSPLIVVNFSATPRTGTVSVGGKTVAIAAADAATVYIDCENQNVYYLYGGTSPVSQNDKITLSDGVFPTIPPGETAVDWDGSISDIQIVPRWWTL